MNWIKLILIAAGLIAAVMLAFSVIGIVYSALWYLFLLGIVAVGGAVAYKLIAKDRELNRLEDKSPPTIAAIKNHDRALEEYKRKHLLK